MSDILDRIRALAAVGQIRISDHGYDELFKDAIFAVDAVAGLSDAIVVEDYPSAARGPSVLTLQWDGDGLPIHVVWAIAENTDGPAVLVTAYRPDRARWSDDFTRRRR